MKLLTLLLTCFALNLTANVYSQDEWLSINFSHTTVRNILQEIEKETGYSFFFKDDHLELDKVISIQKGKISIEDLMEELLENTTMQYKMVGENFIVIAPKKALQEITVKGKVTDSNGTPLPGVNIVEKETTNGAVTDLDGNYTISVASASATLVFSFVGFLPEEQEIGGRATIDIIMVEDIQSLEEVVVIGYGTVKKRDITTSVSSVSSEELENVAVAGFDEAIKGKMAGVRIATTNAAPGGGQNIQIRGLSSIKNSNSPLIVLDGFPLTDGFGHASNPLTNINPSDIESIEVLKDASATAIYGSRASAGVVIITTKKGSGGKPTITFNGSEAWQNALIRPEYLNRDEFLDYAARTRTASYIRHDQPNGVDIDPRAITGSEDFLVQPTDPYAERPYNLPWAANVLTQQPTKYDWIGLRDLYAYYPETLPDVDWYEVISQPGRMSDYQIGVTGGTERINYYFSGGYFKHEGILKGSEFTRFSALINLEAKLAKKLKVGMKLNPVFRQQDFPMDDADYLYQAMATPPIYEPYDQDGNPVYLGNPYPDGGNGAYDGGQGLYRVAPDGWYWGGFNLYPNYAQRTENMDNERRTRTISQLWGELEIIDGLTFRSMLNTSMFNSRDNEFTPSTIYSNGRPYSISNGKSGTSTVFYYETSNTFTFSKSFNSVHYVTALAGYSAFKSINESNGITMQEFTNDVTWTMNNATKIKDEDITNITSGKSEETYVGMFGRLQYNFKGKYYLTGTIRRDGSSKFGPDNRWGTFPSGSVAWRISDESFMQGLVFLSDMKIRFSYGVAGNSSFNNRYISQALLASQQYVLNSDQLAFGYRESNISNPELKWEETTEIDLGFDAVLFDNRLEATFDVFRRETEDLIWDDQVPSIMGQTTILRNVGSVENKGLELALTGRILTGDFKWNLGGNITFYRNEVTALGIKDEREFGRNIIKVGHPLGLIYTGYHDGSNYKDYEESATIPWMKTKKPGYVNFPFPGTTKIIDVNGSGLVDSDDKTIVGCAQPDYYFGLNTDFEYKNFDLRVNVNGSIGMEVLNTIVQDRSLLSNNYGRNNVPKWYYDELWSYDNPDGKYPLLARKNENGGFQNADYSKYGSYFLQDASYINISAIILNELRFAKNQVCII